MATSTTGTPNGAGARERTAQPRGGASRPLAEAFRDVARVINAIRPSVQADGGDVELIDLSPAGVVTVRLHGACVGCPSSSITLKDGLERNIREHVPEVTAVSAVE